MNIDARMLKGNSYLSDNYQKALLGPRFQTWSSLHTLWKRYPRTTKWTRPRPLQVVIGPDKLGPGGSRLLVNGRAHDDLEKLMHIFIVRDEHIYASVCDSIPNKGIVTMLVLGGSGGQFFFS